MRRVSASVSAPDSHDDNVIHFESIALVPEQLDQLACGHFVRSAVLALEHQRADAAVAGNVHDVPAWALLQERLQRLERRTELDDAQFDGAIGGQTFEQPLQGDALLTHAERLARGHAEEARTRSGRRRRSPQAAPTCTRNRR